MVSTRSNGRRRGRASILRQFDDLPEGSTEDVSNRFMRQLLIAGVTRVLIDRKIVNIEQTQSVQIREGFCVHVFNPKSSISGRSLGGIMEGAFEAFDNGYLDSFEIGFVPRETCSLLAHEISEGQLSDGIVLSDAECFIAIFIVQ